MWSCPLLLQQEAHGGGKSTRLEVPWSQAHMEALTCPSGLERQHGAHGHSGPHLTVPLNSTGSWGIMDSLLRRSARPISLILTPSILMQPPDNSTRRKRAIPSEDFPEESKDMQKSSSISKFCEDKNWFNFLPQAKSSIFLVLFNYYFIWWTKIL